MLISKSSLTILDPHTNSTKIFWKGIPLEGVISLRISDNLKDTNIGKISLKVKKNSLEQSIIQDLRAAGVIVREVKDK